MVTLAQRLEALRTEKGLTRPALSAALGMPRNAVEKFETGRQTPTKDQQTRISDYFGVSLAYLQGSTDDRTSMSGWMTAAMSEEDDTPSPLAHRPAPRPKPQAASDGQGGILTAMLNNKAFHDTLRAEILEVLRTREGQELLAQIVKKEIDKQR